jgi:hypothetical protein
MRSDGHDAVHERDLLNRRQLLTLVGVGGLAAAAACSATAKEATTTPQCGPFMPCPTAAPDDELDLTGLPPIAKLIAVLARDDATARQNRRNFNNCPDTFLREMFTLPDDEVYQLLQFDPAQMFVFVSGKLPRPIGPNDPKWVAHYALTVRTADFWWRWKTHHTSLPPDAYDDPPNPNHDCAPAEQYGVPQAQIYKVDCKDLNDGTYSLEVHAQGVVKPFTMDLVDASGQFLAPLEGLPECDKGSTFRCSRLTGKARLRPDTDYYLRLTISGFPVTSARLSC